MFIFFWKSMNLMTYKKNIDYGRIHTSIAQYEMNYRVNNRTEYFSLN